MSVESPSQVHHPGLTEPNPGLTESGSNRNQHQTNPTGHTLQDNSLCPSEQPQSQPRQRDSMGSGLLGAAGWAVYQVLGHLRM